MKVGSIQPMDFNTYWNYKRKKESAKRQEKNKVYQEIENEIKLGKYIDWRI